MSDEAPAPAEAPKMRVGLNADTISWFALIVAAVLITLPFYQMMQPFLVALAMAAIVASMSRGLYARINGWTGGRRSLAGFITLFVLCILIFVPVLGVGYLAAEQATALAGNAVKLVNQIANSPEMIKVPDWIPMDEDMEELGPFIAEKLSSLLGAATSFFVSALSAFTRGTASFFLNIFIFLYALFFFVQMERPIIEYVLSFTLLRQETQDKLAHRIVSVSRATIKGTLLIGAVQGLLGGLGFWATDLGNAAFWGVVMAVFSVIPGIGPGLILTGGIIAHLVSGDTTSALILLVWTGVVTTVDNVLRPVFVGRDAKMHDILILVSTLGGLSLFGAVGLVLGPVLAGLFVTIWTTLSERAAESGSDAQA